MRGDNYLAYYKNKSAGAAVDDKDITVPVNKNFMITGIDFCCPANSMAIVHIRLDDKDLSCSQSDKYVSLKTPVTVGPGMKLTVRLNNSNNTNATRMGATVYYEE